MIKNIFAKSHPFWSWLLASSSNPDQVALTAKGLVSLGAVQAIFGLLPLIGLHPGFDLNGLGDQLYAVTYSVFSAVAALAALVGAIRKAWVFFFPAAPTS